jgi:CRISPR-associated exonuclease Cas4
LEIFFVIVIIAAVLAAFYLRRAGTREQSEAGLPAHARVIYTDTGAWRRVEKPLFSRRYRLTGKPDYVVEDGTGARIPIEVKPNRTDAEPRHSDVMQLTAYGVLVQETFGTRPAYGLLKYRDRVFQVDLDDALYAELAELLVEMRAARRAKNVARSHADAARCRYCGYREECDERL